MGLGRRFVVGLTGVVLAGALFAPGSAAAADRGCGKITVRYSNGSSFDFRVFVTKGKVDCKRARKVMRRGIPVTKPDPPGWYCREARGRYSDLCIKKRSNPNRVAKARLLNSRASGAKPDYQRCKVPKASRGTVYRFRTTTKGCEEARKVLTNRRCKGSQCNKYVSKGKRGRYRCRVRPNRYEGANWKCQNSPKNVVRFQTRAGSG